MTNFFLILVAVVGGFVLGYAVSERRKGSIDHQLSSPTRAEVQDAIRRIEKRTRESMLAELEDFSERTGIPMKGNVKGGSRG